MFKTAYMAVRGQIVGLFVRRQEPVMLSALVRDRSLCGGRRRGARNARVSGQAAECFGPVRLRAALS